MTGPTDPVDIHDDEDVVRAVRGLPLAEYANYDEVLRSVHTPGRSAESGSD